MPGRLLNTPLVRRSFGVLVLGLVGLYIVHAEYLARREARTAIRQHAQVIGESLRSMDPAMPRAYLDRAIRNDHYAMLTVTANDGKPFYVGSGRPLQTPVDHLLAGLGLIPALSLDAPVRAPNGRIVGEIRAEARLPTIYAELYAVILGVAVLIAGRFYYRLLDVNQLLDAKVSERTKALRESEAKFRTLIENIADGVALLDASGIVFFDTDSMGRVLGYRDHEFHGRGIHEIVHPDDRDRVDELLASTLQQPGVLIGLPPLRFRHRSGAWAWVEGTAINRISDPVIAGIVVSYRDITTRIMAQHALRESEEQYRAIVETAEEGIVMVDGNGRIQFANRKLCELSGHSRDELQGRPWSALLGLEEPIRPADHTDIPMPSDANRFDGRIIRKDGLASPVHVSASPLTGADGARIGTVALLTDLSARQKLEEELRQAQKMEAIGVLAGGVAHDFNNVLAVVLGYANLLLDEVKDGDPFRKELLEIQSAAERAAALTRQLLAFSRQQVMEHRLVDLNDVVDGIRKMLMRLLGEDVHLVVVRTAEPLLVFVDPGQIEQVLMNLAVNAREAMPGGGTLKVVVRGAELDSLAAHRLGLDAGTHACLVVADTGSGMERSVAARIFEPFFTTKPRAKGAGLGLSTVFGIIRQSRGGIEVDSEPGRGTTFSIWLPLASSQVTVPSATEIPPERKMRDLGTLLLVEDDERVRKLASTILAKQGYEVLVAAGGGEALILCEKYPGQIDLVLTDLVMPFMRGDELVRRLARTRPDMRVMFMSGYPDINERVGELPASACFIGKPFTPDLLLRRVRETLASTDRNHCAAYFA